MSCGYILEDELEDPQWDELLNNYVYYHGYLDTKVKLVYVLDKVSTHQMVLDREGKYVHRKIYDEIGHPIDNKYAYLKSSMDKAFGKDGKEIDKNVIRSIANQFDFGEEEM